MRSKVIRAVTGVCAAGLVVAAMQFGGVGVQSAQASTPVKVTPVTKKAGAYSVTLKQTAIDKLKGTVTFKKYKALGKNKVKKVKVNAYIKNGDKVMLKSSKTYSIKTIKNKKGKVSITLPDYGAYEVKVSYFGKSGQPKKLAKRITVKKWGIAASEYNIAELNGTMPPLIFSMSFFDEKDITKAGKIPTYMVVSRPASFNWKALPKNVRCCPLAEGPNKGTYTKRRTAMNKYIKNLMEANKNSRFNFYTSDNAMANVFTAMYANGVKDSQLKVHMLTDGSGSYYWFNETYDGEGATDKYRAMTAEMSKLQAKASAGKKFDCAKVKYPVGKGGSLVLSNYAYALYMSHANYDWVVTYVGGFKVSDEAFLQIAKNALTPQALSISDNLDVIKKRGKASAFKKVFNISNELFSAAKKAGKTPLVLMGARVTSEKNFEPFAKFLKKYYGTSKYTYYYKGHPATPTSKFPEKEKQLKSLGILDINSSIPAELIIFYNPEIYVAGLSNSTLNYSYQKGHTLAYLGARLKDKATISGGDLFQVFFTKIDSSTEEGYRNQVTGDASLANSYLVEMNDGSGKVYIYNSATNSYKLAKPLL